MAALALLCGSALFVYFRAGAPQGRSGSERWPIPQIVPFTTLPDQQATPSFSPDGKTVLLAWGSVITHRFSICTMPASGGKETCLTPRNEVDYSPAWSPDGKWIAYLSGAYGEKGALYIRAPGHNDARKISDIPAGNWPTQRALAWTRDSKDVIVKEKEALFLLPLTGQPRQLTAPPEGASDYAPSVSADGLEVVFTRVTRLAETLYRARLDGPESLRPVPLPPSRSREYVEACWFPNRPELLVSVGRLAEIWRMPLQGTPQLLTRESYGVGDLAVSPDGLHALYVQDRPDVNLWSLKLATPHPIPELAASLSQRVRSRVLPRRAKSGVPV